MSLKQPKNKHTCAVWIRKQNKKQHSLDNVPHFHFHFHFALRCVGWCVLPKFTSRLVDLCTTGCWSPLFGSRRRWVRGGSEQRRFSARPLPVCSTYTGSGWVRQSAKAHCSLGHHHLLHRTHKSNRIGACGDLLVRLTQLKLHTLKTREWWTAKKCVALLLFVGPHSCHSHRQLRIVCVPTRLVNFRFVCTVSWT